MLKLPDQLNGVFYCNSALGQLAFKIGAISVTGIFGYPDNFCLHVVRIQKRPLAEATGLPASDRNSFGFEPWQTLPHVDYSAL